MRVALALVVMLIAQPSFALGWREFIGRYEITSQNCLEAAVGKTGSLFIDKGDESRSLVVKIHGASMTIRTVQLGSRKLLASHLTSGDDSESITGVIDQSTLTQTIEYYRGAEFRTEDFRGNEVLTLTLEGDVLTMTEQSSFSARVRECEARKK